MRRHSDYESAVQDMRPEDAVDYLLDAIARLAPTRDDAAAWHDCVPGLTPRQAAIIAFLARTPGQPVPRERLDLATAPPSRDPDHVPTACGLRVQVHHLRKKVAAAGLPYTIETHGQRGYAFHETPAP